jgi:hypothetical protein
MRNASNKSCIENQNTRFVLNKISSENRAVYDNVEKYGGAREAASGNMAGRCMLD